MPNLVIVPVNLGSRSARLLADKLSEKVGHKVFRCKPELVKGRVAFKLRVGLDKLTQLQRFKDANVSCPDFTTDRATAVSWLAAGPVVCRQLLRGSEGRGIVVAETAEQMVDAPLYTRYVKKKQEFRVHVLDDKVIDVQEKRRKNDFTGERNVRIRNVANGYVFCREGIVEPDGLHLLARSATAALGYSLGAVDVVHNSYNNTSYVLEVNSTPGMEGTTLDVYANHIANWYKDQK